MIDNFSLFLPHLLMAIAIWRLLKRDDLDDDPSLPNRRTPFRKAPPDAAANRPETLNDA